MEMTVFEELIANSPIAAGMLGMLWILVKYLRERDQQFGQAIENNTEVMRELSNTISHLEGKLSGNGNAG